MKGVHHLDKPRKYTKKHTKKQQKQQKYRLNGERYRQ